jgi:hypothetical protein
MTTRPDYPRPATCEGLAPFLFWNENTPSSSGAPLACPQCAGANLHLAVIHFAVPTQDHYTPTIAVTIDSDTGAMFAEDAGRRLHAGNNRGAMPAIGYWCENGCEGRLEIRNHKGHLFASLHNEPPTPANDQQSAAGHAEGLPAF